MFGLRKTLSAHAWLIIALLLLPAALISYKVIYLGYRLGELLPQTEYRVTVRMSLDGDHGQASVRTFLPQPDQRQQVKEQQQQADASLHFRSELAGINKIARWSGSAVPDAASISLSYAVLLKAVEYSLSPTLQLPSDYPESVAKHLRPDENIQVDDPQIRKTLEQIEGGVGSIRNRLERIYRFTEQLGSRAFKGTTDALTALRLGEASCNGKSRLFVALARAAGIPSRLVGGIILQQGSKRTSHQWVEAYVGGHWVPFDVTNHHFASLPGNYLVLYRGDEALFRHTADVNFDYSLDTVSYLIPSTRVTSGAGTFNIWGLFERMGLPFSLLRTVLMLPLGALVVVLFRNVVGMPTFGTFLPALIAAAAGETGLLWGLVSIILVVVAVGLSRKFIETLRLLHSPTLAILLAIVVLTMLGTSLAAEQLGLAKLARVSYFPIAVMAIASERFYLALTEEGGASAGRQLAGTLTVVLGCYVVMNSLALQALVTGFPEVLLLVIAGNVYLGRWIGVRVLELWRFRALIAAKAAA